MRSYRRSLLGRSLVLLAALVAMAASCISSPGALQSPRLIGPSPVPPTSARPSLNSALPERVRICSANVARSRGRKVQVGFSNGSWVQEGWYNGCIAGHCRSRNLGRYTEIGNPPFYEFIDRDTAPLSGSSIFRIEYGGSGCWNLYFDYSVLKDTYCALPGSGVPSAVSEVFTSSGHSVGMPVTAYGYSDPNTNNALRIEGANGYVPWTSTLSSGQTGYYDEALWAARLWPARKACVSVLLV
jgi:hypothetical protein